MSNLKAPRYGMTTLRQVSHLITLGLAASVALPAWSQEMPTPAPIPSSPPEKPGEVGRGDAPPPIRQAELIDINFIEADLYSLVKYFARATGRNFVLGDTKELEGKKITIISNKKVSPAAAYEAFMSALQVHGLSVIQVGSMYTIIAADSAQRSPGAPGEGDQIPQTDRYITQIIQLTNISVKDVREIVDNLASENAKVLAYAPTNTLILTDTGHNIHRIYDILNRLDVAAPKSSLVLYPIAYAEASEIKDLIEQLYGTAEEAKEDTTVAARRRPLPRARGAQPANDGGVTAGEESNFIAKVIADSRTNTLIVIANDEGHHQVRDLIGKIDVNVDPTTRSQIYVYRLEHAKAEDVAKVLQDLAQDGGSKDDKVDPRVAAARAAARQAPAAGGRTPAQAADAAAGDQGATAVFDSGMRIAPDENTNSLVIIASKDDYRVIESVIRELDIKRKQVFVDCVILEMSSQDALSFNLAYHFPYKLGPDAQGIAGIQLGANSLGFDPTSLTGALTGVFGQTVSVPVALGGAAGAGTASTLSIPAFGIVIEALKTTQMTDIVSAPSLFALDNEQAKIVVGRKIPFPTSNGLSSLGQPVISYQRQDVAITLEMTPRINSENFVTLEIKAEVQDVEDGGGASASALAYGGPTTSNRSVETSVLVGDNQTVVLGGLVASTSSNSESKVPLLGDLPVIGALFRSKSKSTRRTNLMVFLTPHIVDDEDDMEEIMRVKEAQRAEFVRRFYGKSQNEQYAEIRRLLQYSMNEVERPSVYRGPATIVSTETVDGAPISSSARDEVRDELERSRSVTPGQGAGRLSDREVQVHRADEPATDEDTELSPLVVPVDTASSSDQAGEHATEQE